MKKLLLTLTALSTSTFLAPPAYAGRIEPRPVTCYYFRGEKLDLRNTCTYESTSWAGGGGSSLTWEDGVKTHILWGLQGRGERVCPEGEEAIDGVCGKSYVRDPKTLKPVSQQEGDRLRLNGKLIDCVQVKQNSVCWKF